MKFRYENLVTAIFCLFTIQSAQAGEPTYNGQPLSEWLFVLQLQQGGHDNEIPAGMEQPEDAIRQIGTNGIPTLLDILGAKEGNKRRVLAKLKSEELKQEFNEKDADLEDLRKLAVDGFTILGTNAESAVPQIAKIFRDPETRFQATRALTVVGPAGFSVLTNALASKDESVRNPVIWVLGEKGGSDSNAVTQLLIKSLKDSDVVNQGNAATFLGGKDPAIAIPALIELINKDPDDYITVEGAARGLSSYGSAAKAAAPILLSIYTNHISDRSWNVELMWALKGIDMQTAAKAEAFLVNSGPLNSARQGYTETLLPNGKELIAGGYVHTEIPTVTNRDLSNAELLDPATGKWTETGEMNTARYGHTAILLHNGEVLVAGGCGPSGIGQPPNLTDAELYDSATGKWTKTGSMKDIHYGEKMILQSDGKARIRGAWNGHKITNDEIYDPVTETWTAITNK